MPCLFIFLSVFLFFNSCVSQEKNIKKAKLHNKMALSLMQRCQYPSALSELRKSVKLQPKQPMFHYSIALLYFQFKEYYKTMEHLKIALKLQPNFTDARVHLGQSLIEIGKIKKGIAQLKEAKKDLTYRYVENIYTHLGKAYYKNKQFTLAKKNFSMVRKIKNKNCFVALYHAKSLYFLKEFKQSLNILESAKILCKKDIPICSSPSFEAYFFTALILKKQGDIKKAIMNLQIFLSKTQTEKYVASAKKYIKNWKKKGVK